MNAPLTKEFNVIDYLTTVELVQYYVKEILHDFPVKVVPCGSRVVCDPPVTDTDMDFLVYCPDSISTRLEEFGFRGDSLTSEVSSRPTSLEANPDHRFTSWRKGHINLIVTQSEEFGSRHLAATGICKKLNLLKKEDRIMVYRATLYGEFKE